jgi:Tfp pilus assembly protein PilO
MSAGPFAHGSLQTTLVWGLGTCVVAVVWYAVFYRATHDEWVQASNDLGAVRTELATATRDRDRAVAHAQELAGAERTLALARAESQDGEDLLLVVAPLAAELGLEIDRWRPLADEPAGTLVSAPVEIDARGSWAALQRLLDRLAALPQVLVVDRLEIRAGDGDVLELRLVLGALRLPRVGEAAP